MENDPRTKAVSTTEKPAFSVVMATWNRKYCIDQAVRSFLDQGYEGDCELVIVDDGSTDGTLEYLNDRYRGEIDRGRIRILPLRKVGLCGARNAGIEASKFEWLCYLDTDNKLADGYLAAFARAIQEHPERKMFYAKIRLRRSGEVVGGPFNLGKLIEQNFIDVGVLVHSKDLYRRFGGFDPAVSRVDDWDISIRYSIHQEPWFIDAVLLDYDDAPKGRLSTDTDYPSVLGRLEAKTCVLDLGTLRREFRSARLRGRTETLPPATLRWAVRNLVKRLAQKVGLFRRPTP